MKWVQELTELSSEFQQQKKNKKMDRAQLQGLLPETVSERRKMDIACRGTQHFIGLPGEVGSSIHRNF